MEILLVIAFVVALHYIDRAWSDYIWKDFLNRGISSEKRRKRMGLPPLTPGSE